MLRFARPLAFLLPIIAAVDPAHASCYPLTPFSQVATGNYHYVFLPEGSLATSDSLVGRFWKAGSPALNEGTCDESVWLQRCGNDCTVQSSGPIFWVHGVMGAMPCTSACFDGEMVLLIEDRISSGEFLVARVDESPGPIFDFSRLGDLTAVSIPRVNIQSVSRTGGQWTATVRVDDPAQGFYGLPGVPATGTITGIQILSARGNPPPPERAAWTLLARVPYAGGQTTAQVAIGDPCPSNDPRTLYLAAALELDGQVVTHYVSPPRAINGCVPERWYGGGHVPESGSGALQVSRSAGGELTLSWGSSCVTNNGYAIYEGVLGDWTSHIPLSCGATFPAATFSEPAGNSYFLVVPTSINLIPPDVEGSYGLLSNGSERPRSSQACIAEQAIVPCP